MVSRVLFAFQKTKQLNLRISKLHHKYFTEKERFINFGTNESESLKICCRAFFLKCDSTGTNLIAILLKQDVTVIRQPH